MVVAKRYFIAFALIIVQLSVCYSKNVLEDNRQDIQKICDNHKHEKYDEFVKNVKKEVGEKVDRKVEVVAFNVSDSSPVGKGWDYKIGRQSGDDSNGIILGAGDIGVAIYIRKFGCKNESIFQYSITGDKQFNGPCQQLLEAMAQPNYIQAVCATADRTPTQVLEKNTHFSYDYYCYRDNQGVFTFTRVSMRSSCAKAVKVVVRQLDNCKKN